MTGDDVRQSSEAVDAWVNGSAPLPAEAASEGDPLLALMIAAGRVDPQLSSVEAKQILATARQRGARARPRRAVTWVAAAAAALALASLLLEPSKTPSSRAVRRQIHISAERDGQKVELEVTVYEHSENHASGL